MIRTQVYIPEDLYKEAKLYAQIEGKSISDFIREGLKKTLRNRENAKRSNKLKNKSIWDLAGKYTFKGKKKTNAAATHNDIYDL